MSLYSILGKYSRLDRSLIFFITGEFFLHLVNAAFFLILNIYMSKLGYSDPDIANYISYRFLTVMILAYPFGMFIRTRRLKPFMYYAAIVLPVSCILFVIAVTNRMDHLLIPISILMGSGFFTYRIVSLPYILRNCEREMHSEAISLSFTTWSMAVFISGISNFVLNSVNRELFNEHFLLLMFSCISFASLYCYIKVEKDGPGSGYSKEFEGQNLEDWKKIIKALTPTLLIATGAGLTIQFINLFFFQIYGMDSNFFSLMGAVMAVIVSFVVLLVPSLKRRFGYKVSITLSQSLAVLALICLASTEYFSEYKFMVYIAIFFYILRQPLMNMANPLTSELAMYYVGKKNQEITSAITAAIWSGSWFLSGQIFRVLRASEFRYAEIFYITAGFYTIAIILFYLLIIEYQKNQTVDSNENRTAI